MVCYLCGESLLPPISRDHVPPQQFFAPELRRVFNLDRLVTVETHAGCNEAYQKDEEYFVWSLAPLASDTVGGRALLKDHVQKVKARTRLGLAATVRAEFDDRPSGLHLPAGLTIKRIEGARISRVGWKVVRGLYFLETGEVLPEGTKFRIEIVEPYVKAPRHLTDFWDDVRRQNSKGEYQAVFAHKYLRATADDDPDCPPLHVWALLLWDRLILYLAHFDPRGRPSESGTAV